VSVSRPYDRRFPGARVFCTPTAGQHRVDLGVAGHAAAPGDCGPFRGPAPGSAGPEAPHGENVRGARRLRPDPVPLVREAFGHEPTSYLRLRRMSLVYRALWCGDPDATTISEAARRYGFRELGRFAGAYRHLFGGLPSASLRWSLHPGMAHLVLRRLCRPRVKPLWHPPPTLIGEGTKR
jgi:hypothetical protein